MNLVRVLGERAREFPDREALVEGRGRKRRALTFFELEKETQRGAAEWSELGVKPGDAILFAHPVAIDLYTALLSAFRLGAVAMFVDPSASAETIEAAVNRLRPRAFFGSGKAQLLRLLRPAIAEIPLHVSTAPSVAAWRWGSGEGIVEEVHPCGPDFPALITFTSGSTGQPKAAVRTHGFLITQYETLSASLGFRSGEVDLVTLPIFTLANLAAGMTSVIADTNLAKPGQADADAIVAQIEKESVSRVVASPAFFERLNQRPGIKLDGLRHVFTGGAPVFPQLMQRLTRIAPLAEVVAVYGSTEAEPIAHLAWGEVGSRELNLMRRGKGLLAGMPIPEIELAILPNRWGQPIEPLTRAALEARKVAVNTPGEIAVAGRHVLTGYLDGVGDEETKFKVDGVTWHRAGDAGMLDEEGRLWLLGRAGAVIRDALGEVFPFAVETALSFHEELARSALVGLRGKRILVVEPGDSRLPENLLEEVSWAGIDRIVSVDKIPVDRRHNAKVDYPALKELVRQLG